MHTSRWALEPDVAYSAESRIEPKFIYFCMKTLIEKSQYKARPFIIQFFEGVKLSTDFICDLKIKYYVLSLNKFSNFG